MGLADRHFRTHRPAKRLVVGLAGRAPRLGEAIAGVHLRRQYGSRVVTPEKIRNYLQVQRDIEERVLVARSLPYIMSLDTLNTCNLRCRFCPTGTGQLDRKRALLGFDRARRAIDAVRSHLLKLQLYCWGEPFLDPHIFDTTRHAVDAGIFTVIHSALSVRTPDLARRIVDSGLDLLNVSLDGITQDVLETYRRGAELDRIVRNLRDIVEERERRGSAAPRILMAFHVFRHNEHQIPALEAFRRDLGIDEVEARRAYVFHEPMVPTSRRHRPRQEIFEGTCHFLYADLTLEADGALSPCDTNTSQRWNVGRLEDLDDLWSLWNGPTYQAMRAVHAGLDPAELLRLNGGEDVLCRHCEFVCRGSRRAGPLSQPPPSFTAAGIDYAHGFGPDGP